MANAHVQSPDAAPAPRMLAALGSFRREHRYAMSLAAEQAGFDLEILGSADEVGAWLSEHGPQTVLVDTTVRGAEQVCLEARSQSQLASVPILAVARELSDLAFAEVFSWGGDDVVELGAVRALTSRLRSLPPEAPEAPDCNRGAALIADDDRKCRVVLARVLRSAGYEIKFAVSAADASRYAVEHGVDLVVASSELGDPAVMVAKARDAGSEATWIVRCRPRELQAQRRALAAFDNAVATDGYAPPENVLFLANELGNQRGCDNRATTRILYGTSVAFRGAGRERDEHGFTFNVSAGGIYVRTLAPPSDDCVWLELAPPRSDRRVRLEGRVAWRRKFGPNGHATVPPGFGVQITDGASADLEAWRAGYRAFAEVVG